MSLTISTASGSRELLAYRVVSDPMEYALRGEISQAGRLVTYGDRGVRVLPLQVEVSVQEDTFPGSLALAQLVLEDAERAISLTLPRGTRPVDGITDSELVTDGPLVRLRLWFVATGGYQ